MRTYGRDADGKWVLVVPDENGFNDSIYLTTLIQNLKLAPQESPFFANNGIPSQSSVIQLRSRLPADQHRLPARNPDRGTGADSGCDEKQIKPHR